MDKRTLLGTLLIAMLLVFIFKQNADEAQLKAKENTETEQVESEIDSTEKIETEKESIKIEISENDSASLAKAKFASQNTYGIFFENVKGEEKTISIENNKIRIDFSSKGAQIKKVELKEFKKWDKTPLYLIDNSQEFNFVLTTKDGKKIDSKDLFFDIEKIDDKTISLKVKVSENKYLEQKFSLKDDSYFVDFDLNFVNLAQELQDELEAEWNLTVLRQEKELSVEKIKSSVYWRDLENKEVDKLSMSGSDDDKIPASDWLAYTSQFFNATFLTENNIKSGTVEIIKDKDDTTRVADCISNIEFKELENQNFQYFFGPNDYILLKSYDKDLEQLVELSANFFLFNWVKYITKGVFIPMFHFLEKFTSNYGIIIIILTLIIRMAMMPLTFKSYVSMAKTRLLKPELDALREKYKDDQSKFASEQMKLYQSTGVSMFGGCLPMLLQMPFFLAMFYFFPSSIELRQESFLWATDLSSYDVLFSIPKLPILGSHISGFTLLMTISSLAMAKFNPQMQNQSTQPGMEMMKYMPYIFPFFLFFMFNSWAAALTLYYFVSNMATLGQQLFINKFMINEKKLKAKIEANKKKKPKKGGFRQKLEKIQEQQKLQKQGKKK